jgi:hypothetical protein
MADEKRRGPSVPARVSRALAGGLDDVREMAALVAQLPEGSQQALMAAGLVDGYMLAQSMAIDALRAAGKTEAGEASVELVACVSRFRRDVLRTLRRVAAGAAGLPGNVAPPRAKRTTGASTSRRRPADGVRQQRPASVPGEGPEASTRKDAEG